MTTGNGKGVASWQELSRKEALALLDERAHRLLGMSGEEFLRRAKTGRLPKTAAASHLLVLAGARTR